MLPRWLLVVVLIVLGTIEFVKLIAYRSDTTRSAHPTAYFVLALLVAHVL